MNYFSRDNDDSIEIMNELHRRAIFFIENRKSIRWVLQAHQIDFSGDGLTNDPLKAMQFESQFQAMTFMVEHKLKYSDWSITEHEFVWMKPSEPPKDLNEEK